MADAIRKVLRKALQSLELPTSGAFDPSSPDAHTRRADEHVVWGLTGLRSVLSLSPMSPSSAHLACQEGRKSLLTACFTGLTWPHDMGSGSLSACALVL